MAEHDHDSGVNGVQDLGFDSELQRGSSKDDDGIPCRTGTMWTAAAHILTAVVGSGVLSLPWSIAQLGWTAGPLVTLAFAYVTYFGSVLLADCYRFPDPVTGRRNRTYMSAVKGNLAGMQVWICGLAQYSQLFGVAISYVITASSSMVLIKKVACFHEHGKTARCTFPLSSYMAIFAGFQVIFAQISDLARLWWLSVIATVTSFFYCLTGLGLAIVKLSENGRAHGTVSGASVTSSEKLFQIFQALGNIAFAYSFSIVLIEIQDTLRSSPPENLVMKKALFIGILITTLFYMSVACAGYMAFGNSAPGNLLTGFYEPYWLVIMANVCIVVHLTGSYQLCSQPIFAAVEHWASRRWPESRLLHSEYTISIPFYRDLRVNWCQLAWRSLYVMATMVIALVIPFFNDVVGLIGAFGFWPLTVYFPVKMYMNQAKILPWRPKWIGLQTMSVVSFAVSVAAAVGSVQGIVEDLKTYAPFKFQILNSC